MSPTKQIQLQDKKLGGCPRREIPFKNVFKRVGVHAILNWAMTFLEKTG